MIEATRITTYSCSIPQCPTETRTVGGNNPDPVVESEGWGLRVPVMAEQVDLCPDHVAELQGWLLNGES